MIIIKMQCKFCLNYYDFNKSNYIGYCNKNCYERIWDIKLLNELNNSLKEL